MRGPLRVKFGPAKPKPALPWYTFHVVVTGKVPVTVPPVQQLSRVESKYTGYDDVPVHDARVASTRSFTASFWVNAGGVPVSDRVTVGEHGPAATAGALGTTTSAPTRTTAPANARPTRTTCISRCLPRRTISSIERSLRSGRANPSEPYRSASK